MNIFVEEIKIEPEYKVEPEFVEPEYDIEPEYSLEPECNVESELNTELQDKVGPTSELIPIKSKKIYSAQYDKFVDWCSKKNIDEYTENVLLEYFCEESKNVKCSTMWSHYSMLKSMLAMNKNIDISKYGKLVAFLKGKNDGYQPKKSNIFTRQELETFFSEAPDNQFLLMKVVAIMGIAGACRRDDLAKMTIDDIQDVGSAIIVNISDNKTGMARSFKIMDNGNISYLQIIRKYMNLRPLMCCHRRLFVNYDGGKCMKQPVGVNKIGKIPSEIATYLKLTDATAYTGHSFRRTPATFLVNGGADIMSLKRHGGWTSTKVTEGYRDYSIKIKQDIAKSVLRGGKEVGDGTSEIVAYCSRTEGKEAEAVGLSEIGACSSKTLKLQTLSAEHHELQGKVVLVTGASSGIGAAIAEKLGIAGAKVALAARRTDRLQQLKTRIESHGGMALCVTMDVCDEKQVHQAVQQVESQMGPINILVNNAGVLYYTLMKNLHLKEWKHMVDVNIKGVLNCIEAVLGGMVQRKQGHIVNISSDGGRRGFAGLSVYCGTKFFIEGLSQSMRHEVSEHGIKITCIQPGDCQTELFQKTTDAEAQEQFEMVNKMKVLEPEDVARAVLFAVTQPEYCAVNEILVEPRDAPI